MAQNENYRRSESADRDVGREGGRRLCNRIKPGNRVKWVVWSAFFCAFVFAAVALLTTARALVIGPDDRVELAAHEREEFKAVGLIASRSVPRGTAFLVCDCLTVVTAAHLAVGAHGDPPDQDIEFLHDGHHGTPHLLDKVTISMARSAEDGSYDPYADWLIARLVRPVPDCRPLQYENSERIETWKKVSMIGFHSDLMIGFHFDLGAKRISKDCSTSAVLSHKGLLVHMCDGAAGSSGSPMLFIDGNDPDHQLRVVAIQSGEQRYVGFNVAVLFSTEFEKALGDFVTSCDAMSKTIAQRDGD